MKLLAVAASLLMTVAAESHDGHDGHGGGGLTVDPPVDVHHALVGNTISALVYVSHPLPRPHQHGVASSSRVIFHAWLRDDGTARVRLWDEADGRWITPVDEAWQIDGDTFCLGSRRLEIGLEKLCMRTLVWGPVFTGAGVGGDIMVKGNILPGNASGL